MLAPAMIPVTAGKNKAKTAKNPAPSVSIGLRFSVTNEGLALAKGPCEKRDQGHRQDRENTVLDLDGPTGSDEHTDQHGRIDDRADRAGIGRDGGECGRTCLGEPDHIHGYRNCLSEEEHNADRSTEFDAQTTADQIVGSAASHPSVRGNGRQREAGEQGNHVGQGDDRQGLQNSGSADNLAETEKHDHAENRQGAGREDASKGPEPRGTRLALVPCLGHSFFVLALIRTPGSLQPGEKGLKSWDNRNI